MGTRETTTLPGYLLMKLWEPGLRMVHFRTGILRLHTTGYVGRMVPLKMLATFVTQLFTLEQYEVSPKSYEGTDKFPPVIQVLPIFLVIVGCGYTKAHLIFQR